MTDLRTRLLAMRAELDRLLDELDRPAASQADSPTWMHLPEYARARRLHVCTVRRYIAQGMPAIRAGRSYRIRVEAADAWLAAGGAVGVATRCGSKQARGLQ